jgi:hypothetical protein
VLRVEEAVALGVVGLAGSDRGDERGQETGVHLPVPIDLDEDVAAVGQGGLPAGLDRGPDATVLLSPDDLDPGVVAAGFDDRAAPLRTGIVDHIDGVDLRADP